MFYTERLNFLNKFTETP